MANPIIRDRLGSMTYPATIAPSSFNTGIDVDDESDIIPTPQIVVGNGDPAPLSSLHYHLAMAKLAEVIQTYIKGGRGYSQSNVADAMQEVESIYELCPLFNCNVTEFETKAYSGQNGASWIFFQRYLLTHTFHFIRLTIVRGNFSLWLHRQPDQHDFHRKALDAAEAIVNEKNHVVPQMYRKSWYVTITCLVPTCRIDRELGLYAHRPWRLVYFFVLIFFVSALDKTKYKEINDANPSVHV